MRQTYFVQSAICCRELEVGERLLLDIKVVFISFNLQSPGNFIKFVLAKECNLSS